MGHVLTAPKRHRYLDSFSRLPLATTSSIGTTFTLRATSPRKDPCKTDTKVITRYGIDCLKFVRTRRKRAGFANLQYIRFRNWFILLATHGEHRFIKEEGEQIRDLRRVPLKVEGYSIGHRLGQVQVRIERNEHEQLNAYFLTIALHRSASTLAEEFAAVPYELYAPIRGQLLCIWRAVNWLRKEAGYEPVPREAVRCQRRILQPIG